MKTDTGLAGAFLLAGMGLAAYLLSQSSATVSPFLALIVIFVLVLLRPLRQLFLPQMTFTPSASLLKWVIGSGAVLFAIIVISLILLLAIARSEPLL